MDFSRVRKGVGDVGGELKHHGAHSGPKPLGLHPPTDEKWHKSVQDCGVGRGWGREVG